ISDRVGVMYGGRLVEVAPVGDLFGAPRHPYTKALIATMPASWRDGEVPTAIGGTSYGANRLPGCPFAPRCPVAAGICHETMPDVQSSGPSMVRCHHVSLPS
ncbi:MAG: oligopeptide/dipeptide ABC transporter ATP-binding protein, partial [Trebonia sp.]